jgi:hypothetical protein
MFRFKAGSIRSRITEVTVQRVVSGNMAPPRVGQACRTGFSVNLTLPGKNLASEEDVLGSGHSLRALAFDANCRLSNEADVRNKST